MRVTFCGGSGIALMMAGMAACGPAPPSAAPQSAATAPSASAKASAAPRCQELLPKTAATTTPPACPCGDERTCIAKCDAGSADDCFQLSSCYANTAYGWAQDLAKFHRASKRACELGNAVACRNLGDTYRGGFGVAADPKLAEAGFARARVSLRAGCDANDAGACHVLAHVYRKGDGVAADEAAARTLDVKSCRLGHAISCMNLFFDALLQRRYEDSIGFSARLCELMCDDCDDVIKARERGSPAAATALADMKARCARGETLACEAASRIEKVPAGLPPRVRFSGNTGIPAAELTAAVQLDKPSAIWGREQLDEALERDAMAVMQIYFDRGYLDVQVAPPAPAPDPTGSFLDVHFRVAHEGPRYRLGKLVIEERDAKGKRVAPLGGKDLRLRIRAKNGDWYPPMEVLRDIAAIRRIYEDAGYGGVRADISRKTDPSRGIVDVEIPVRRGPLVRVEHIAIEGNRSVSEEKIRAAIGIREGQQFSGTALEDAKRRLEALGVFRKVGLAAAQKPDATRWTVTFVVEE